MSRYVDMTGQRVGRLSIIEYSHQEKGATFWLCQCDCGNYRTIPRSTLVTGKQKSCGCWNRERPRNLSNNPCYRPDRHEMGLRAAVRAYKRVCRDRERTSRKDKRMLLSDERIAELLQGPCYYCGEKGSNTFVMRTGETFKHNGIDRVDSSLPYIEGNVVSCCKVCNKMKQDLSTKDFLSHIRKIVSLAGGIF